MQLFKPVIEAGENKTTKNIILFFFRVVLGLTLFIKGINFVSNQEFLEGLISNITLLEKLSFLKIAIPFIHILGGIFIIIGVYTRPVIVIQLPIIFGAIVLLLISGGMSDYIEIIFAMIIFILLISYLKFGDGFYSWKNLINKEKNLL